ncbi:MAG: prepilin peptidase [Gammaproteobacteria bacterium]|nr:prepilin peptidase [Gammaproteobacteria bacterium]
MLTFIQSNTLLLFYFGFGLLGVCVGSFINVVIHRLPIMIRYQQHSYCYGLLDLDEEEKPPCNLIWPRSNCPHCSTPVNPRHNIPVISYVWLVGKCHSCEKKISIRYPLIECITAAMTLHAGFVFGPTVALLFALVFCWFLISLCFIDIETQLLPDNLTLPLLWIGLIANYSSLFNTLESAVLGAVFGYCSLWLIYHIHRLITGKPSMGYGDFKLLAALGAWTGWELLPMIILLSSISGILFGLIKILLKHNQPRTPIAFGPFLAGAGWATLFWGMH